MTRRKPVVAMNWSMRQNTTNEAVKYTKELVELTKKEHDVDKIIFPSMGTLNIVADYIQNSNLEIGAQNFAPTLRGEYSGEYSLESLVDIGGSYVELGHWERRQIFKESDDLINQKLLLAMSNGLSVILCVGETERLSDTHSLYLILKRQLFNGLLDMREEYFERLIIAYTPKWAVGKSTASNAPHIHHVCKMIRKILEELFLDSRIIKNVRVVYGGSVSPENTSLIISNEDVDGVLVGRFGSDPNRLLKIIDAVKKYENK